MAEDFVVEENETYIIPDGESARHFGSPPPAPAAAPPVPAAPPEVELTAQRKANQKLWDAWRENWAPGDSLDVGQHYARVDLAYRNRLEQIREGTLEDPRRSIDPKEASIGLAAPEAPDSEALVRGFEQRGESLTPEGYGIARAIATILPAEMHLEGERVMRDVFAMEPAAKLDPTSEDRAILALDPGDVALFRIMFDQLPVAQQRYLTSRGLGYHVPAIQRIARAAELWLGTDAGIRWTLRGGGEIRRQIEAMAAKDYQRVAEENGYGE